MKPVKTTTTVLCTHHLNFIHLDLSLNYKFIYIIVT